MKNIYFWFVRWLTLDPHYVVGEAHDPYLLRWYVIPRNKFFNVYLHKFLRDDDPRALHDHPWWFISLVLKGGYTEIIDDKANFLIRTAGKIAYRPAVHKHRVVLPLDENGKPKPCWTLILTGRVTREWGFWCPRGFVHYKEFTAPTEVGNTIGRGCD